MLIPRDPPPAGEWEYFKMSHHIEFDMQPQKGMDGIFEPIMIVRLPSSWFPYLMLSYIANTVCEHDSRRRRAFLTSRTPRWMGNSSLLLGIFWSNTRLTRLGGGYLAGRTTRSCSRLGRT